MFDRKAILFGLILTFLFATVQGAEVIHDSEGRGRIRRLFISPDATGSYPEVYFLSENHDTLLSTHRGLSTGEYADHRIPNTEHLAFTTSGTIALSLDPSTLLWRATTLDSKNVLWEDAEADDSTWREYVVVSKLHADEFINVRIGGLAIEVRNALTGDVVVTHWLELMGVPAFNDLQAWESGVLALSDKVLDGSPTSFLTTIRSSPSLAVTSTTLTLGDHVGIALSLDGTYVALHTGGERMTLDGPSPVSDPHQITIFDTATLTPVSKLTNNAEDAVMHFFPDGTRIVVASGGTVTLYQFNPDPETVPEFVVEYTDSLIAGDVAESLAIEPDLSTIYVGSSEGRIYAIDLP